MQEIPQEENLKEKMSGQRVMLVGGAGFIGHNLALALRRCNCEVMILDNLMINSVVDHIFGNRGDMALQRAAYLNFLLSRFNMLRDAGVHLRNVDARLLIDMHRHFDEFQPTQVVHLSAIASAVNARKDPGLCFDLQLITLRNVLELCRHNYDQVSTVMFLSSSTVYGDFKTASVDETVRPQPKGIYANTKFMGERLIRTYTQQYGLGSCIVRPSALYGERCISRRVSQVFIENAILGKPLLLEGGGDGRLDFTYIEDLVDGMVRALGSFVGKAGGSLSNTFNLTFGNARRIADLTTIIKEVVPSVIIEERPRAVDKPIRGTLSTKRAEEELGFKAQWTLETGYRKYCEWYVEQFEKARREMGG